jgi:ankyrin repeat protein
MKTKKIIKRMLLTISLAMILFAVVGALRLVLGMAQGFHAWGLGGNLQQAALHGDVQKAKSLLAQGADPNFTDMWSPLEAAVQNEDLPMAKVLIGSGADVNGKFMSGSGRTALAEAASRGNRCMVRFLLSKGANVNVRDRAGKTALQLATDGKHTAVAALLSKAGERE